MGPSSGSSTFKDTPSFPKSDDPSYQTRLVDQLEAGLALYPLGHPNRYETLHTLAISQSARFNSEVSEQTAALNNNIVDQASIAFSPDHSTINHPREHRLEESSADFGTVHFVKQRVTEGTQSHYNINRHSNLSADTVGSSLLALPARETDKTVIIPREVLNEVSISPRSVISRQALVDNANEAWKLYNQQGQPDHLDKAILCLREALSLPPNDDPSITSNLSAALLARFQRFGRMSDLEECIVNQRKLIVVAKAGDSPPSAALFQVFGASLVVKYEKLGGPEALEEAITSFREALELPCIPPVCWGLLNSLGVALMHRFKLPHHVQDLDEAITCHTLALQIPGLPEENAVLSRHGLAGATMSRFCRSGQTKDLDNAIRAYKDIVDCLNSQGNSGDLDATLDSLGTAYLTRFEWFGQTEDLGKAINNIQQALELRIRGHPRRSQSLGNLAGALGLRYDALGRTQDLDEAIACERGALELEPPGHPSRSMMLNNLAASMVRRFKHFKRLPDLDEAILLHRDALALRPPGHVDRSMSLSNLGLALYARFNEEGEVPDIEESIVYCREDLRLRPEGHPEHCTALNNLGSALLTRYERLKQPNDLEEAIQHLARAEAALPSTHPHSSSAKLHLARAYVLYGDYDRAIDLLEHAADQTGSSAQDQLQAATYWASVARDRRHESALRAYVRALALLDRCLVIMPLVELQQQFLAEHYGQIASQAASWAIEKGELEVAVELLEQGRSLLWSKMRGYRHTVEKLREVNPELAEQFEKTSLELQALTTTSNAQLMELSVKLKELSFDAKATRIRELTEKWEDIVAKIRQVDGFSHFLCSTPFSELRSAASEGPVVIVNIDAHRNDAIIVLANHPLRLVPLRETLRDKILNAPTQLWNVGIGRSGRLVYNEKNTPSATLIRILKMLWHEICKPVVAALAGMGVPDGVRIWWCPVGELSSLPLHAAGPYAKGEKCLYDIFISSYTPTLNSLLAARIATEREQGPAKLLAVGQSTSDFPFPSLPQVTIEFQNIKEILSDHAQTFDGDEATPGTVLPLLGNFPWLHLSCHGTLQAEEPFESGFVLRGGRLSLRQIMQANLPHADLAFLAACQSAAGAQPTPDEALSLAAALQFCGFGAIVGTLWAMSDEDAPGLAQSFYEHMVGRGLEQVDVRESAKAVHLAVKTMREEEIPVERWCTFVHIGV